MVNVSAITLQELCECDEVFITNSVIGIKPITKINDKVFTQQQATQEIAHAFNHYVSKRKNAILLKPKKPYFKVLLASITALILAWAYWANMIKTVESFVYQLPKGANITSTATDLKRFSNIF